MCLCKALTYRTCAFPFPTYQFVFNEDCTVLVVSGESDGQKAAEENYLDLPAQWCKQRQIECTPNISMDDTSCCQGQMYCFVRVLSDRPAAISSEQHSEQYKLCHVSNTQAAEG
jgi:hypothetical protein